MPLQWQTIITIYACNMRVISFVAQKGGSGKSTLSIACALEAVAEESNVLLVDMDAQKTLEQWYQNREKENINLVSIDEPNDLDQVIKHALKKKIDYIFVDTPGRHDPSIAAAIKLSDFCIIPCRPTSFDMKATPETVNTIKRLGKKFCFVINQTAPRGARIKECSNGLSILGTVSPVYLPMRISYQDAYAQGLSVKEYEKNGKADLDIISLWEWLTSYMNKVI
ncbi:MAG: ParA family protein [Legionellales bacterium]|nr:ParA family protein [Legionellales bacterium]